MRNLREVTRISLIAFLNFDEVWFCLTGLNAPDTKSAGFEIGCDSFASKTGCLNSFENKVTRRKDLDLQCHKTEYLIVRETELLQAWNIALQLRYRRKSRTFSHLAELLFLFCPDSLPFWLTLLWVYCFVTFRPDKFFHSPGFPLQP